MVTNPPYGERISTPNLLETYRIIGEKLKHAFVGNEAWILSYREECFEQIGLRPSIKFPVFNGSLECEFRKYTIFEGKLKEYRSEGGVVKTDEERSAMAEKHRFKKNREFKQRIDEENDNEEGDIRTFTFHHHKIEGFKRKEEEDDRRERRGGFEGRRRDDRKGGDRRDDRRGGDRRDDRRGGDRRDDRRGNRGGRFDDRKKFDKRRNERRRNDDEE